MENTVCPNCGYCPHCGRGAAPSYTAYPIYPVYPWWPTTAAPWPYGTLTVTSPNAAAAMPSGMTTFMVNTNV